MGIRGQQCQKLIHLQHTVDGQAPQEGSVKELKKAPAEALLNGVQVIGEQAHEVSHLIHLVVVLAQVTAAVKHPVPQVLLHPGSRAENGDPPQKSAEDDGENDPHHGHADAVQQNLHGKGGFYAVNIHIALVNAVNDHLVQSRDLQLEVIHGNQRRQSHQQKRCILPIVAIDILSENHVSLLTSKTCQNSRPKRSNYSTFIRK